MTSFLGGRIGCLRDGVGGKRGRTGRRDGDTPMKLCRSLLYFFRLAKKDKDTDNKLKIKTVAYLCQRKERTSGDRGVSGPKVLPLPPLGHLPQASPTPDLGG